MEQPRIADTRPAKRRLAAGRTVYWCRCGRSRQQPFCDGSHAGTGFEPLAFTPEEDDEYFLCQCKRTARPPFCDGSHKRIAQEELDAQAGFRTIWHRLAGAAELADGESRAVQAGRRALVLVRIGEQYAALDARCPHRGGPLADGELLRDAAGRHCLRCPWHGSDFDALTGHPPGGQGPAVESWPVELRDDGVYVALREPLEVPATVAELLADTLGAWGLQPVFASGGAWAAAVAGTVGGDADPADRDWLELPDPAAAAAAAATFARLSGGPAACAGPAVIWPALLTAAGGSAAVLAIVERRPPGLGAPAEPDAPVPEPPLFEWPARDGSDLADTIGRACRAASLRRGPALLVLPAAGRSRAPAGEQRSGSPAGRIWNPPLAPAPESVAALGRRLQAAQRPAIVVGDGAGISAAALVELADRLGAPVLTSRMAKGSMPETDPLSAGVLGRGGTPVAAWCLREADLLLLFGACPPALAGLDWLAEIVQVDADVARLGALRPVAEALPADPGRTAAELARGLGPADRDAPWRRAVAARRAAWQAEKTRLAAGGKRDRPEVALFERLGRCLPAEAVLVVDLDAGNDGFTRYFDCREQRVLLPAGDESQAFGLPAMIAASLATRSIPSLRGRPVIGLSSREHCLAQWASFVTAARLALDLTLIVPGELQPTGLDPGRPAALVAQPPLADWASEVGASGRRLAGLDELEAALRGPATGGTVLLELGRRH